MDKRENNLSSTAFNLWLFVSESLILPVPKPLNTFFERWNPYISVTDIHFYPSASTIAILKSNNIS